MTVRNLLIIIINQVLPNQELGIIRGSELYREMDELFGVELRPHNRFAGAKILRQRWQAHIQSTLRRPVLVIDEAQEMQTAVLAELRLLASTDLDSNILLTVVSPAMDGSPSACAPMNSSRSPAVCGCACRSNAHRPRTCKPASATPCGRPAPPP